MAEILYCLLPGAAAVPLLRATIRCAGTAVAHALGWAWAAWLAWAACMTTPTAVAAYVALALTGCAGVAVLGARRPGVWMWHAVVVGLLVVLLVQLAEGMVGGGRAGMGGPRVLFLGTVLAVGIGNYLVTRFRLAAAVLAAACALALLSLAGPPYPNVRGSSLLSILQPGLPVSFQAAAILAMCAPLTAWAAGGRSPAANPFDRTWLEFRDRYGAVWAHRVREQFNAAARHAGLTVELTWHGGRGLSPEKQAAAEELLAALIRRFGV